MRRIPRAGDPKVIKISARGRKETLEILRDQVKLIQIAIQTYRVFLSRNLELWLDVARQGFAFGRVQSQVIDHSRTSMLAEILAACHIAARLKVREQAEQSFAETFPKEIPPHKAIEWLKDLPQVTRDLWEAAVAVSRQPAFFITGIEQQETLRVIQQAISDSLQKGQTLAQFESAVRSELHDLALSGGRLRNVWHNSVSNAYTATRDEEAGQPEIQSLLPYFMFDALIDNVTRDNHALLDNGIAPQSWEGWSQYKPLLGFNCRCVRILITAGRAMAMLEDGSGWDLTQGVPAGAGPDDDYIRMTG
jgi:hypothetical protein